ncbi:unnamed protein product, partial [Staurois parvus]
GDPRAIGDHGARVSLPTLKEHPKKAYIRYQGHLMEPPIDPGPPGSARVSKWSVCSWAHHVKYSKVQSHWMISVMGLLDLQMAGLFRGLASSSELDFLIS